MSRYTIRNVEYREKALLEMKRLLTSDGVLGIYILYTNINYALYIYYIVLCAIHQYAYITCSYTILHLYAIISHYIHYCKLYMYILYCTIL